MGPAFEERWKEFFQHRPDKAVAIFSMFAGFVHVTPYPFIARILRTTRYFSAPWHGLPPRNYLGASCITVRPSHLHVICFPHFQQLYPMSLGSVHIKIGEDGKEELDITTGYLDK